MKKDRRNSYVENDKASRKGIPLANARSHRSARRKSEVDLQQSLVVEIYVDIGDIARR